MNNIFSKYSRVLLIPAVLCAVIVVSALFSGCSSYKRLSIEELKEEYDPQQDGYNYYEDMDDYYYDYMGY
jgi:hypothetical protein